MPSSPAWNWRPALAYLAALILVTLPQLHAESARPNIVFIIADDLGWGDLGFHGGNVPTPNLDRLARESIELTQHYVYPVCSPTRASLLSGRYATRFGVTNPQNQRAFPWETTTLARALKDAGYDTALIGKWHLGSKPEEGPQKFGFDHGYGSLAGGVGPWDHRYKEGPFSITWHRNGTLVEEKGHVTDLLAAEGVQWLKERSDRPFFLYLPFTAVHIPIREPEEYLRRVPETIKSPAAREYAACVMHLDDAVGRILTALRETGRENETIVIFTSDNGAYPTARNDDAKYPSNGYTPGQAGGTNEPLRGTKTTVYEGGIRVPTLLRWPGKLPPGKFNGVAHVADWMPTFCGLAGYKPNADLRWDGIDLWPQLSGAEAPSARSVYIAGPGFKARALRNGDWKLVVQSKGAKRTNGAEDGERAELFNLAADPNETRDLAPERPDEVTRLRAKLNEVAQADKSAAVARD